MRRKFRRWEDRPHARGFLTMELLVFMMLLAGIMGMSLSGFDHAQYTERIETEAFAAKVKGAFIRVRLRAANGEFSYTTLCFNPDGSIQYTGGGKAPKTAVKVSGYSAYIEGRKGVQIFMNTTMSFKNMVSGASNSGFTICLDRGGKLIGRLIFQVGTSSFREEYYE